MKRSVKKLVLHKETVRNLQEDDLGKIAGGFSYATCHSNEFLPDAELCTSRPCC